MLRVAGTNCFRALIPPQTIGAGNILFEIDGFWESGVVPASGVALAQGGVKKYSITLP
jgi:hypothetical protein